MTSLAFGHSLLAATGFDYALQQPVFPGKLFLWALFMLSILSWGVMISKAITFFRMQRSDDEFTKRYRATRQPLQMFERNYQDDLSMRWVIYDHGAREAAFQMLGSPERDETFAARLKSVDGLTPIQMKSVREALNRGELAASAKLRDGMSLLGLTSLGAPFIGLLGMGWIMMKTFSANGPTGTLADVSPGISGGLAMLVVGLLVATPALIGQILLGTFCRKRMRKLGDFRSEMGRSIEHFYVIGGEEMPLSTAASHRSGSHHAQPGMAYQPVQDFDGRAMEHAAASLEASVDPMPFGGESPFVLIDEAADPSQEERPIAAFANPDDDLPPMEQEYLFRTPFAEAEMNPIARQTTGLLGSPQAAVA
ncbi:MAG: MotA/TolQ/ExbB proton channel family protein [Verrucomicrobiae bacterium]|nr:MotA/TolQ/ExbB proton channel family protein [Verrucomicrobiae bacterium]MCB1090204.1 MotA/TolQ/ExbB proton channel family protein [Verrucomicrobiae bacterium]